MKPIVVPLFILMTVMVAGAQKHNKVDCNSMRDAEQRKLTASVKILNKIDISGSTEAQAKAEDQWTRLILQNQDAICQAYKNSDETAYPTAQYLADLEKLRSWELVFFQTVGGIINVKEAQVAAAGKKGSSAEVATALEQAKASGKLLLSNPPTVAPPPSAAKP